MTRAYVAKEYRIKFEYIDSAEDFIRKFDEIREAHESLCGPGRVTTFQMVGDDYDEYEFDQSDARELLKSGLLSERLELTAFLKLMMNLGDPANDYVHIELF